MKAWKAFENILPQILGIVRIVGIIIALLNSEIIGKFIRDSYGFAGIIMAAIVGSVTLIPGCIAFPTAGILLENGAGYMQLDAFISSLMGLLDVWVPNDVIVKYMGPDSGITAIILSIFIGSTAAGPLYGVFPIAAVFMKKGVELKNILIFIGAWSTTKIRLLLFEISSLGTKFALTRLMLNIPGILLIAYIINRALGEDEKEKVEFSIIIEEEYMS